MWDWCGGRKRWTIDGVEFASWQWQRVGWQAYDDKDKYEKRNPQTIVDSGKAVKHAIIFFL